MSTLTKILLILAVLYILGMIGTLVYIANHAEDRQAAGLPVFTGGPNATPGMQLVETAVAWPVALAQSVGS